MITRERIEELRRELDFVTPGDRAQQFIAQLCLHDLPALFDLAEYALWRTDMENAPRDGRPVELHRHSFRPLGVGQRVVIARWVSDDINAWCWPRDVEDIFDEAEWARVLASGRIYNSNGFFHWRPITPPEPKP